MSEKVIEIGIARKARTLEEELAAARARIADLQRIVERLEPFPLLSSKLTEHSQKSCQYHAQVLVDETTPRVECAHCQAVLDPFEVLRQIAQRERHLAWTSEDLRDELRRLAAERDRLKAQVSRLRTKVRKEGGEPGPY